ncbi:extracellular solute-binding protein [Paenibacillus athensensis]|uniref:extracellular solute-binding protein n=1 Tax=Paenibacillus athensensis TaxID=1967502 RepID=UPI001E4C9E3A|nr:extracellular solute-binding protein [Paenibacillus athensensis]
MKLKMRKNLSVLTLVAVTMTLTLSACSSGNSTDTSSASPAPTATTEASAAPQASTGTPKDKVKPVTFSQYVNYDWFTALKWGDQPHTKWVQENLKININPVQANGAAANKLNAMIVSGELPDVIVLDRGKDVERLQQAGKLVALDPYLEKYPEFVKAVGEKNINMLRSADGKLYQLPNWFISGDKGNGNAAYIVEKKIYKALGSPKLETFDDLEAYLKMVKEKYPDVVPFDSGEMRDGADLQMVGMVYSGFGDNRTSSFISPGAGLQFGVPNGDKMTSIYEDPAFQGAVTYVSKLYREGLTSKDMFTQTRDQIGEKLNKGKIAVFAAYDSVTEGLGRTAHNNLRNADPEDGYITVWPFHAEGVDKNKVFPGGYSTLGWNVNVITTNAKDPEAIFAYYNWLVTPEAQNLYFFGPQGLYWDKLEDGVPVPNDAYINRDPKKYDEQHIGEFLWAGNTSYIDGTKGKREQALPEAAQDWTTVSQSTVSFKTSLNTTEFSNMDPDPKSDLGIIMQRLKDQYKNSLPKMIFAKSDDEVKSIIAQTSKEAQAMGYDKVLEFKSKVWQDNLKKLSGQ